MSDVVLGLSLIVLICNAWSFVLSVVRHRITRRSMHKKEALVFQTTKKHYNTRQKRNKLRKRYVVNAFGLSVIISVFSASPFDFAYAVTLILLQYSFLYRVYEKQTITYFLFKKGVVCSFLAHPTEKHHLGLKKWKEITYFDKNEQGFDVGGEHFFYQMAFSDAKEKEYFEERMDILLNKQHESGRKSNAPTA